MKDFIKYHFKNSIYLYIVLTIWSVITIFIVKDSITFGVMSGIGLVFFLLNLILTYRGYKDL